VAAAKRRASAPGPVKRKRKPKTTSAADGKLGKRPKPSKHVPSDSAKQQAESLAERMPLVHFPASAKFSEWSSKWDGLRSKAARGLPVSSDRFGALCDNHVFFFAGPCCYHKDGCIGDAALYFAPGIERGRVGGATPFDSGSLEPPAQLQPFGHENASADQTWNFFTKHQAPLHAWREAFSVWLAFSYDDPNRYIESSADRYAAGQPDRTDPAKLLQHNGTRGVAKHGRGKCGDRRAWTWEIRVQGSIAFEQIALLHVPFDAFEDAHGFADDIKTRTGARPRVRCLGRDVDASVVTLYEGSSEILLELVS
jgi:hypothetical protein